MRKQRLCILGSRFLIAIALILFPASICLSQPASWTIMVYLDGDNNLEDAAIDDVNEMEMIGSSDEVNIIVQFDRIDSYDETNGDWKDTRRFRIIQDEDEQIIGSPAVQTPGELNMGDPATLTDFINWSVTNYPADHYALILWNHGGGWYKSMEKPAGKKETPNFKDVCYDDTDGDVLTNIEVGEAIAASGIHFDMLAYDACVMGMIEVAYQTRNTTDVVLFSEDFVPWDGFAYTEFLDSLTSRPDMTVEELSESIIVAYGRYYEDNITLAAFHEDGIREIAEKLDTLTARILENGDVWDTVGMAWQNAWRFTYTYMDLGSFANEFGNAIMNSGLKQAASDLNSAVTNATIYKFDAPSYPDATGLTFYFPEEFEYDPEYAASGRDFADSTNWVAFLEVFHTECYLDQDEPNNHFANATSPDFWEPNTGKLKEMDDIDIFRFFYVPVAGSSPTVEIDPPADFNLYLYSVADTVITLIDSSANAGTAHEILSFASLDTGYYFVTLKPVETSEDVYELFFNDFYYYSYYDYEFGFPLTYVFDDGEPNSSWYTEESDNGVAMQFTPNGMLDGVWYYISQLDAVPGDGDQGSFTLMIYDLYWDEVYWGYSPVTVQPSHTGWNYIDLSEQDIQLYYEDMLIGFIWDGDNTPALGMDFAPDDHASFLFDGSSWTPAEDSMIFFIRPVTHMQGYEPEPCYCEGTTILTDATGSFEDGSGNEFYGNNCECSWLIQPEDAISVTLTIHEMDIESGWDYVMIYDDQDRSHLLATLSGQLSGIQLTSETGEMLIDFTTDGSVTFTGWQMSYTCEIEGPEGLTAYVNSRWSVYPNPGDGLLNIRSNTDSWSYLSVTIFNTTGQIVSVKETGEMEDILTLDLSSQTAGIYYIRIIDEDGISLIKYILQ